VNGEAGSIGRYLYWSDRLVREIAQDNAIDLDRRAAWTFSASFKVFSASRSSSRRTLFRDEVADRIRRAVGRGAVDDFVTPPPVRFATGAGRLQMGEYIAYSGDQHTAYLHTRVVATDGTRCDVCVFGSMHNYTDWTRGTKSDQGGWVASSGPWIERLLRSRGAGNTWPDDPDDFEPIAMEALKVVTGQGVTTREELHEGLPQTRAYTLGHADEAEWFAQIICDVELTTGRWLDDETDRILIGFPLWVRSTRPTALTAYTLAYRAEGRRQLEERRRELEAAAAEPGQGVATESSRTGRFSRPARTQSPDGQK
jgi:hypothetical protein